MAENIEGTAELVRALRRIRGAASGKALARADAAGAEVIVERAQELAPKDTRAGAKSIAAEQESVGPTRAVYSVGPDRRHFYMRFHEFGTVKMAATPFLRPALRDQKAEIVRKVGDELWAQIRRAGK